MHKRTFLQALLTAGGCCLLCRPLRNPQQKIPDLPSLDDKPVRLVSSEPMEDGVRAFDPQSEKSIEFYDRENITHVEVDASVNRAQNFNLDYTSDIFLPEAQRSLLETTANRLAMVQLSAGHGNFNLLSFDELIEYAQLRPSIGAFTHNELAFIDEIFHTPAEHYGFYGEKVITKMTHRIIDKDVFKVEGSGHYLLQGEPLEKFKQLRRDVGQELMLTSGIRNSVKQLYLFLAKTRETRGNLSKTSRSIAPPGYSFHGVGDFDVGSVGLGERNFTSAFSNTQEFKKLMRLGYIDIRYPNNNSLGVRFEPWHIKVS